MDMETFVAVLAGLIFYRLIVSLIGSINPLHHRERALNPSNVREEANSGGADSAQQARSAAIAAYVRTANNSKSLV